MGENGLTGILNGARGGVDPVLADAGEELGLLDGHGLLDTATEEVEESGTERGSCEPAEPSTGHGQETQAEDGVHGDLA